MSESVYGCHNTVPIHKSVSYILTGCVQKCGCKNLLLWQDGQPTQVIWMCWQKPKASTQTLIETSLLFHLL